MRLDEFIEGFERDERAEKRRLAAEKSYAITDHLEDVERQFEAALQGDALFGSTAPEIFVGRSGYPDVSTGLLSPVDRDAAAEGYATSSEWYSEGLGIEDVLQRRTGMLNSTRRTPVGSVRSRGRRGDDTGNAYDVWSGFVGVQREVAIADHPVDVEVGLDSKPDMDVDFDDVGTPTGPRATATGADLTENPHVPKPVEKTLSDDDWQAAGAMTYLYRRGFDVYDINTILSAASARWCLRGGRLRPSTTPPASISVGRYATATPSTNPNSGTTSTWATATGSSSRRAGGSSNSSRLNRR